jgi:hypothetical protein
MSNAQLKNPIAIQVAKPLCFHSDKFTHKTITTLNKFDVFMHCLQHGHDANKAHDN